MEKNNKIWIAHAKKLISEIHLGSVNKLCCLKGGRDQKLPILLSKKTTTRGSGSKIDDFETTQFMDGPLFKMLHHQPSTRYANHPLKFFNADGISAAVTMQLRSKHEIKKISFTMILMAEFCECGSTRSIFLLKNHKKK